MVKSSENPGPTLTVWSLDQAVRGSLLGQRFGVFFNGVYGSIYDYNYKPPKCKLIDFNQFLTTARALIDSPQNPSNLTFYKHLKISMVKTTQIHFKLITTPKKQP